MTTKEESANGVTATTRLLPDDGSGWERHVIRGYEFDPNLFTVESANAWLTANGTPATVKIVAEID